MNRTFLALCTCLFACGGTISGDDGGADAAKDATKTDSSPGFDSGGGPCTNSVCATGLVCCNGACVNTNNDPHNCSGCGLACTSQQMCLGGSCAASQCQPACTSGQTCCEIDGPGPSGPPTCEQGDGCPVGCPLCN